MRGAGLRLWTGVLGPTPGPGPTACSSPTPAPTHCSQIHHCGRDSRSPRHSGSWPGCTCSWRHSGTAWARTHPRGAWQLGDRARRCGQQTLPSRRTTQLPGHTAALMRPTHCRHNTAHCHCRPLNGSSHYPVPLSLHLHSLKQVYTSWSPRSTCTRRPQKHKTSVKGTGQVAGIPRHQVMPGAVLSTRKALQGACTPLTGPGVAPDPRLPPVDQPEVVWHQGWVPAGHL